MFLGQAPEGRGMMRLQLVFACVSFTLCACATDLLRERRIVVEAQSNVCVSVHVDQRLLPQPVGALSIWNFSGHLMSQLRRAFESRGGSAHIPGTQNQARFFTNEGSINPFCQDTRTDVLVDVRYQSRLDDTPFVVDYRISQGRAVRFGRLEVNVAEEIRLGHIQGYSQRRTNLVIIEEHIQQLAPTLIDQIVAAEIT
jgi:hypothetical protein